MSRKVLIPVFFLLALLQSSCRKDPISVCGVEDPALNLEWLRTYISKIYSADVFKLNFNEQDYVIISSSIILIDGSDIVFNCEGEKLCQNGGENITHVCSLTDPKSFWEAYYNKKLLLFRVRNQEVIFDN
jgi:hypothetical protein